MRPSKVQAGWGPHDGSTRGQLQPADEQFAFEDQFLGQMGMQIEEKFLPAGDFLSPRLAVHALKLLEKSRRKLKSRPVDVLEAKLAASISRT